jgi:hypothetical protein
VEVLGDRAGLLKLRVVPTDAPSESRRALCYTDLVGPVAVGEKVLLNTTAVDLDLGTGGWDYVVANLSLCEREARWSCGGETSGHLMKLRYAPHQVAVQAAEEASPDLPEALAGRPVIVAELHSQIAPILLGLRRAAQTLNVSYPRVAYLMPDTAALPIVMSDLVPLLRERGLIHATVTCGQAFGGDYEAVTLGSGMTVASGPAEAEILLVAQGPGNAGTGSPLGFGGMYGSEAVHLAAALDGDPILAARVSEADPRDRHRGLSHHTRTLLDRLLLAPVTLPLPRPFPVEGSTSGSTESLPFGLSDMGRYTIEWAPEEVLMNALEGKDLPLRSMGRGLKDDPAFFTTSAAAGWVAGRRYLQKGRGT